MTAQKRSRQHDAGVVQGAAAFLLLLVQKRGDIKPVCSRTRQRLPLPLLGLKLVSCEAQLSQSSLRSRHAELTSLGKGTR
jgi:hypothetical protein